jgi:hypothetical protein
MISQSSSKELVAGFEGLCPKGTLTDLAGRVNKLGSQSPPHLGSGGDGRGGGLDSASSVV